MDPTNLGFFLSFHADYRPTRTLWLGKRILDLSGAIFDNHAVFFFFFFKKRVKPTHVKPSSLPFFIFIYDFHFQIYFHHIF